jgi:hypothetical protein
MTFGMELVVLLTKPSMFGKFLVHVWRYCGGLNKENILNRFMKGQTHFGMSRGAEMSLVLHETI